MHFKLGGCLHAQPSVWAEDSLNESVKNRPITELWLTGPQAGPLSLKIAEVILLPC